MSRFVPIPHEALEMVTPQEYGAVADLYFRAHRLRWRPFRVSWRSLATSWGVSQRHVGRLVRDLESVGLIRYEAGGPRAQSTIEVFDPTLTRQVQTERRAERTPERTPERKDTRLVTIDEDCGAHPGAQGGAHPGASSTRPETRDLRPRPETDDLLLPRRSVESVARKCRDDVWRAYRAHHPRKAPHPSTKERAAMDWAISEAHRLYAGSKPRTPDLVEAAAERVLVMVDWIHEAPDASFYRGDNADGRKYLGLESPLLKRDKFAQRLESALQWHDAGRPGPDDVVRPASRPKRESWMDRLRRQQAEKAEQTRHIIDAEEHP